ncbi:uncharacterized protein B0T23DRAFT_397651 [Neurospora hispaniola]|uniref:Uncharacterized protein n=1 Tax=Neurospora hispaniola TaxID=588809 RepID=A0AAJ0I427_9PEZI|nr:hypothetical protein B0T23DRAFT_397651 [Neurospora hispaniola]
MARHITKDGDGIGSPMTAKAGRWSRGGRVSPSLVGYIGRGVDFDKPVLGAMMEKRHSRSNIGLESLSSHYITGDWRVSGPDVVGSENHMSDAESRGICQDMLGTQNIQWKGEKSLDGPLEAVPPPDPGLLTQSMQAWLVH